MRRQYLVWSIAVFGVVGTIYGGSSLIFSFTRDKGLYLPGLFLFIFGVLALLLVLILFIISFIFVKKREKEIASKKQVVGEAEEVEPVKEEEKREPKPRDDVTYETRASKEDIKSSDHSFSTVYIKQVGYGPLLRVEGNRIIDMRSNTYYRIEDDMVMQEGFGPVFEIRGNQIKNAFGGYLYEISGSNINKVFGGFYASISGNYITLYDLSIKYEMTDSLSKNQILAVATLLFGNN